MRTALTLLTMLTFACFCSAAVTDDAYKLGPDSMVQPGVPTGKLIGPTTLPSNVFPGTKRNYWVYTPAQYDKSKPACLMILQDGHAFLNPKGDYRIPTVFDNLIYRREMPVTIAVFINPGHKENQIEPSDSNWGDGTTMRGLEYNALDDKYARLIIDELLPELKKTYNISANPDDHAIAGASSGAICAFTVAWQRPDQFRKVISTIGSFTNIRGGNVYPDLIMKEEPKPIRVFLQDGLNDIRGRGSRGTEATYDATRDWHAQNIKMAAALTARHYDFNYTWGSVRIRTSKAARSCRGCCAGSGAIIRAWTIRKMLPSAGSYCRRRKRSSLLFLQESRGPLLGEIGLKYAGAGKTALLHDCLGGEIPAANGSFHRRRPARLRVIAG